MSFLKYSSILLILFLLTSCENRDNNLNDSENMMPISDIRHVYANGIHNRVRKVFNYYYNLDLSIK
jgi:hypothetical protein